MIMRKSVFTLKADSSCKNSKFVVVVVVFFLFFFFVCLFFVGFFCKMILKE